MMGQCVPYMMNTTSSNILFAAAVATACTRAATVGTVGVVDEDEGGLLKIWRTIRSRSCRDTKRADHCERRLGC